MLDMIIDSFYNKKIEKLNKTLNKSGGSKLKKQIIKTDDKFEKERIITELLNLTNEIFYKEGFKDGVRLYKELKEV